MPTYKPASLPRPAGLACRLAVRCLILLAALMAVPNANARPQVVDIELVPGGDSGQVQFMMDGPAEFHAFTLSAPLRLVLDLQAVDWRVPTAQLERVADRSRLVRGVRRGNFRSGAMRIVFDLDRPISVTSAALHPRGSNTALVLAWQTAATFQSQQFGGLRKVPIPPPRPSRRQALPAPVIVLDPGHGGIDPGAIGRRRTLEKTLTLTVARQLQKALRATGRYKVHLTRNDDRFLALRERTRIARRHGADLFLSLHADSAPRSDARGLSVYTLSNESSDAEAAALAARENKADVIGGLDLSDEGADVVSILIDLAQRETRNQSMRLANQLVQAMVLRVPVLDRPHRQAGFAVLKAPDIPAALIELGFLSHPEEERLLLSADHRAAIIDGIVAAVDNFFAVRHQANAAAGG